MIEKLTETILFSNISTEDLGTLIEETSFSHSRFKKNETILYQGTPYEELCLLLSGECHSRVLDFRGRELKIERFIKGAVFAPAVLFASDNSLPGSVIADSDVETIHLTKDTVMELCTRSREFTKNFLGLISDKFGFISGKLTAMSFRTIREKLAYYLLSLPPEPDGSIVLSMTIEELARYFGVSRPSLSRVFGKLESQGVLKKRNRNITILDIDVLLEDAPDE